MKTLIFSVSKIKIEKNILLMKKKSVMILNQIAVKDEKVLKTIPEQS